MKTRASLLISCVALSAFLFGCDSDDAYEHGWVQCHATYVIDDSGDLCYFGDCNLYDNDLRDHYCPSAAPFCIEDNAGRHYCGTHCPSGTIQTEAMCNRVDDGCESNEILCDGVCIDPKTNHTYCGSDDQCIANRCQPDQVCTNGKCLCPDHKALCNDKCVDIESDKSHCGACTTDCTQLEGWADGTCDSGQCSASACIEGYHTAEQESGSIVCEPDITEPCGISGEICPIHSVCDSETESCQCEAGFDSCEDGCFDLMADAEHCGNCETVCNIEHADNVCNEGVCSFTCQAGYVLSADGTHCELQQTDACTEGEKRCNDHSFEICKDGAWNVVEVCSSSEIMDLQCDPKLGCIKKCITGYDLCSPNLCIDTTTSIDHCGTCNHKCNVAHATNICKSGTCSFTCDAGYVTSKDGSGCEAVHCTDNSIQCSGQSLQTCKDNHWVTTQTCTSSIPNSSATCEDAKCGWKCNTGFAQCSDQCINLQTDTSNCGKCGTKCNVANAKNTCSSGKCSFTCNSGYIPNKEGKGCEIAVCSEETKRCDGLNFQTCTGNKWATTKNCTTSVSNATATCNNTTGCGFSCNSKYTQCSDKCVDTTSDNDNCGGCNKKCNAVTNGKNTCNHSNCTITCNTNYLLCNTECVGSKQKGIVHIDTKLYTSPGGGPSGNAKRYDIYPVYGKYTDYYAINVSNQKRYIDKNVFYILPVTGKVEADSGLIVRNKPTRTSDKIGALFREETVSIVGYETGEPINGVGWFEITSPVHGYVAAYYVKMESGSSAGSLQNCP